MAIIKPSVVPPWAENVVGNPSEIVQPTNSQIQAGWSQSTTPPARQRWNWVLNWLSNAVRYFMRRGVSDYDAAETYALGDLVRGDNGLLFRSLVDNNLNHTPSISAPQWGSPLVPTTTADDSTAKIASTAYVIGQISVTIPAMNGTGATGTSLKFARADHVHPSDSTKANTSGTYNSMSVGYALQSGGVSWPNVSLKPTTVDGYGITDAITTTNIGSQSVAYAGSAGRAYPYRWDGNAIAIIYGGQGGQPNWLLGTNDGFNFYVWNPANFSVNAATNAQFGTTQPVGTSNTSLATTAFVSPGASHAGNGYERLPSGLILQWGTIGLGDLTGGGGAMYRSASFPIAFPSACLTPPNVSMYDSSAQGGMCAPFISSYSNSGFTVGINEAIGRVQNATFTWFAIGY